jgi:hypothetical protein
LTTKTLETYSHQFVLFIIDDDAKRACCGHACLPKSERQIVALEQNRE